MSTVPYIFANNTGNIPLSQLDADFANVKAFANTAGYVTGAAQANITSVGTLTSLSVSGNVAGGNILTGGLINATGNINGGNLTTGGLISASGNIAGGNILTGGRINATGNILTSGNITGSNLLTGGLISATGAITVNSGGGATALINGAANAVGNIGSASNYFNQVFAQSTTALYADLAEVYSADAEYVPGTVVSFGGNQEITISTVQGDIKVAGVISENPSYLMNSGLQAQHRAAVALAGRVPTKVIGPVTKGAMMVSAGNGQAQACATPAMGTVIGKALTNFSGDSGTIEIVVGRM